LSSKLMRSKQSTSEHKSGEMPFLRDGHTARVGHLAVISNTIHPSRSSSSSSTPLILFFYPRVQFPPALLRELEAFKVDDKQGRESPQFLFPTGPALMGFTPRAVDLGGREGGREGGRKGGKKRVSDTLCQGHRRRATPSESLSLLCRLPTSSARASSRMHTSRQACNDSPSASSRRCRSREGWTCEATKVGTCMCSCAARIRCHGHE